MKAREIDTHDDAAAMRAAYAKLPPADLKELNEMSKDAMGTMSLAKHLARLV